MMNNNKILTVSYGTFSCTLEGFDDSFGTMKAIAEYFRDLAADDRYFGAEPPQPDADMLARIAQREVSRKVQARERDGQIVLSALEGPRDVSEEQPTITNVEQNNEPLTAPAPAAPIMESPEVSLQEPETIPEIVLSTAPVSFDPEIEAAAEPNVVPVDFEPVVEKTSTVQQMPTAEAAAEVVFEEDENDIVPGQPDAEVEAFFADAKPNETVEAPTALSANVVAQTDTIAAKLERIRAVVAQNDNNADESKGGYAEDQHAEVKAEPTPPKEVLETARVELEAALDADVVSNEVHEEVQSETPALVIEPVAETEEAQDVVEDVETAEPDNVVFEAERAAAELDDAQFDDEIEDELDDQDDDVDAILARLASATSADSFEDDDLPMDADTINLFEDTIGAESDVEPVIATETESTTDAKRVSRARVIKVKRADLDAAIRDGALEEYDDEHEVEPQAAELKSLDRIAPSKTSETSLTAQDEQELLRELENLEMDIKAENAEVAPKAPAAPLRVRAEEPRSEPKLDDGRNTDVNRLLAEADQQMDEPESATRRDAFSHLRAAVAAQKADVALGVPAQDDASDDAYRDDLAKVVRPRRPESGNQRTARPGEGRPAPLKLVAEQRIDVKSKRPDGPIRPRRVSATTEPAAILQDGESFAEYAAEMGAATLPQLLEAAAAYMSFVEGREQFSRPQLMTKVRQSGTQEDFSREDGLRSFGQLLRSGKIAKIKGGRFTVSDDIGFKPDQRAVG